MVRLKSLTFAGENDSWDLNVFLSIKYIRILAVYIYDDNINCERYCYILENVLRLSLNNLYAAENQFGWCQHVGAPPHSLVHNLLFNMLEDSWIDNHAPFL